MKLINPTNTQLNEAFAREVCGWIKLHCEHTFYTGTKVETDAWAKPSGEIFAELPDFCSDVSSVLPWLDSKLMWYKITRSLPDAKANRIFEITAYTMEREIISDDESLARACVIALLRTNGVEIEFT